MLLHAIQAASLEARKNKDTARADLLVTLYAEAQRVGKDAGNRESTDAEVLQVVRKFLKNVDEFLRATKEPHKVAALQLEKQVLEYFLPAQADEAALRAAIADVVAQLAQKSPKAMGAVMAALKERFGGNYDGALASRLAREALDAG